MIKENIFWRRIEREWERDIKRCREVEGGEQINKEKKNVRD